MPTLQDLRKAKYPTIKAFAEALGRSSSYASMLLQGRYISAISNAEVNQVATLLGVDSLACYNAMSESYTTWMEAVEAKRIPPTPEQIAAHEASIKATVDKIWPKMSDADKRRVHEQAVAMGISQERRSPIEIMIDNAVKRIG